MELDTLKYIWKQAAEDPARLQSNEQIHEMLKKKSQRPVAKMKRNLLFELIFALLLYAPLFGYYLFGFEGNLTEPAWLLMIILAIFLVYYYRKNKLLTSMLVGGRQVKLQLEMQLRTLEKYIRFYLMARILVPVSTLFLGVVMYWKLPAPAKPNLFYPSPENPLWQVALLWMGILSVITILIYFADRWYVHTFYGRHIGKLRELVAEMNET
jgi:hypothetical protein